MNHYIEKTPLNMYSPCLFEKHTSSSLPYPVAKPNIRTSTNRGKKRSNTSLYAQLNSTFKPN